MQFSSQRNKWAFFKRYFWVLAGCCLPLAGLFSQTIHTNKNVRVYFKSDAPLELIEAQSDQLKGVIDFAKNSFAFSVDISSFQGFNSPLQKEHFNENYLESRVYKSATFAGKIIEQQDLTKDGEYTLRAKGKLTVHGVAQERIIKSLVRVKDGKLRLEADFTVLLQEHAIEIPRLVHQKIAEEIQVRIEAEFSKP